MNVPGVPFRGSADSDRSRSSVSTSSCRVSSQRPSTSS